MDTSTTTPSTTPSSSFVPKYGVCLTNESSTQETKIDSIVFSILQKFVQRADFGFKKYGTNLDRTDLSILDWIIHAQEEHMDAILYLEKLKHTYMHTENKSPTPAVSLAESLSTSQNIMNNSGSVDNLEKSAGYDPKMHNFLNGAFC